MCGVGQVGCVTHNRLFICRLLAQPDVVHIFVLVVWLAIWIGRTVYANCPESVLVTDSQVSITIAV